MTQLEKSVFGAGFVAMTEEELYEVNGGWGRKKEKADKPKKEKIKKEKHTHFRVEAQCGDIKGSVDYENSSKTSIEKTYEKDDSVELNRIDNDYIKEFGNYIA